jgi:hypothetical protein
MIAQEANPKSRQRSSLCPSRWHQFAPAISGHSLAFPLVCVGSFRPTTSSAKFLRELPPQASCHRADRRRCSGADARRPSIRRTRLGSRCAKFSQAQCSSSWESLIIETVSVPRAPVYQDCESADCGSDEANRKRTLTRCMTDKRDVRVQLAFILSSRQFRPPAGTEKRCVARAVAPAWASAAGRVSACHHLQIEAALGQGLPSGATAIRAGGSTSENTPERNRRSF